MLYTAVGRPKPVCDPATEAPRTQYYPVTTIELCTKSCSYCDNIVFCNTCAVVIATVFSVGIDLPESFNHMFIYLDQILRVPVRKLLSKRRLLLRGLRFNGLLLEYETFEG